jgi:hypothetical protein
MENLQKCSPYQGSSTLVHIKVNVQGLGPKKEAAIKCCDFFARVWSGITYHTYTQLIHAKFINIAIILNILQAHFCNCSVVLHHRYLIVNR